MITIKSRFMLSVLTLLLFSLLISLGIWQLHRAEEKRLLLNNFSLRTSTQYLNIKDLEEARQKLSSLRYFPVKLHGHYDNAHVFLLDNKFYQHQLGYEVLTPFINQENNKLILVNRGWIPRNPHDYPKTPIIPQALGEQTIHGLLYVPLRKAFMLKQTPVLNHASWPIVTQALQFDYFERQLKKNTIPAILWLNKEETNGFLRDWHPVFMLPQQHVAYAMQWFALALTLLIIYIILTLKRNDDD